MEELEEYFEDQDYIDEQGNEIPGSGQSSGLGSFWAGLLPNVLNPAPIAPARLPNAEGDKLSGAENVFLLVILGVIISFAIIAVVLLKK